MARQRLQRSRSRAPQRQIGEAETRAGELPVIGDRVLGGALISFVGVVGASERVESAALPIGGARDRDRRLGMARRLAEMRQRRRRILPEAQRDESGMPFGVDLRDGAFRAMAGRDLIGQCRLAAVEQFPRDQPALDPPFVAVSEQRRIARDVRDRLGGFSRLVLSPRLLRQQEGI